MSEVIEYRMASLKTFIAYTLAVFLLANTLLVGYLAGELSSLYLSLLSMVLGACGVMFYAGARGRETDGVCRRVTELLPWVEYDDPPEDEWAAELEQRGEFRGDGV